MKNEIDDPPPIPTLPRPLSAHPPLPAHFAFPELFNVTKYSYLKYQKKLLQNLTLIKAILTQLPRTRVGLGHNRLIYEGVYQMAPLLHDSVLIQWLQPFSSGPNLSWFQWLKNTLI